MHPQYSSPWLADSMDVTHENSPQPPQPQPQQSPALVVPGLPPHTEPYAQAGPFSQGYTPEGYRPEGPGAAQMPYGMPRAQLTASMPPGYHAQQAWLRSRVSTPTPSPARTRPGRTEEVRTTAGGRHPGTGGKR